MRNRIGREKALREFSLERMLDETEKIYAEVMNREGSD